MSTHVDSRFVPTRSTLFPNRQLTVDALSSSSAKDLFDLGAKVCAALVLHTWRTLQVWRERAQSRNEIRYFDERMLRDLRMTAADARREMGKYPWQE